MAIYTVTNGITYLKREHNGIYHLTSRVNATEWQKYDQALNALNNGIGEWQRDVFYIEVIGLPEDLSIQKLINADTSSFESWCHDIDGLKKIVKYIDLIKNEVMNELRSVEAEICDILHYIEFNNLNAAQGWAAYEMIKTSRLQRRKIKDLLYIIDEIQKNDSSVPNSCTVKKAIAALNNREYRPRKLNFLFDNE